MNKKKKQKAESLLADRRLKYILGVVVLIVLIGVGAVLWYIEANPTETNPTPSGQEQDEDEKGGLHVEESGDGGTFTTDDSTGNQNTDSQKPSNGNNSQKPSSGNNNTNPSGGNGSEKPDGGNLQNPDEKPDDKDDDDGPGWGPLI